MEPARIAPLIQDQNLDVHCNGGKTNVFEAQNHGRVVKTESLPDLSNSATPSEFLSSRKKISLIVSKANENSQVGGRKAISDLTNSVNGPLLNPIQEDKKKKKEEEDDFCPHDHEECRKAMFEDHYSYFLRKYSLQSPCVFNGEDNSKPTPSSRALTRSKPEVESKESEDDYSYISIPSFNFKEKL